MKRMSIKLRVTLLFTVCMLLFVTVVTGLLLFTEKKLKTAMIQNRLMEVVDNVEDSKRNEVGKKIAKPIDSVYISIYDSNGNKLAGILPDSFEESVDFKKDKPRVIHSGDQEWYVYDILCKKQHNTYLWTRGILAVDNIADGNGTFVHLLIWFLPIMAGAIALLGYGVTSRAFQPVNEIIKTAEKIGEGADLSQRIRLGEGTDEIYTLANTFDHMFEKLETYFEHEKRFTADASHELRTPVSVILSQCEYAIEHAETIEEAKEALEKISQQAMKMSSLIANLLTLARMDNGHYNKWNLERINLSELADVIIEQQMEFAEEKGILITNDVESDIYICAEETMIMRMLINLIENSIQYGKENGQVKVSLAKKGQFAELKIRDNGIGIAPEHLNKIWERFYQVDPSRNNLRNNTGLGLAMVKWIVEAHKGSLAVQSELGKGSVFTVLLPCKER